MTCPCCGEQMALGYLQCRDGLHWTPGKQPVAALSVFGRGSVPLENGAGGNRTVYAHRCTRCGTVLIPTARDSAAAPAGTGQRANL